MGAKVDHICTQMAQLESNFIVFQEQTEQSFLKVDIKLDAHDKKFME